MTGEDLFYNIPKQPSSYEHIDLYFQYYNQMKHLYEKGMLYFPQRKYTVNEIAYPWFGVEFIQFISHLIPTFSKQP